MKKKTFSFSLSEFCVSHLKLNYLRVEEAESDGSF